MIGPLDIDRHRLLKSRGIDLHVFVDSEDVTHRCRYADDTPGRQVAVLFRHTRDGHCHLDEDRRPAMQIVEDDVVIRPLVLEP